MILGNERGTLDSNCFDESCHHRLISGERPLSCVEGEIMHRHLSLLASSLASLSLLAEPVIARPRSPTHEIAEPELEVDVIGNVDGTSPETQKALQDTVWIADWTFDSGGACTEAGWVHVDNHILNDGVSYWHPHLAADFPPQTSGMAGNVYAVGYHDNPCCEDASGYATDWYQGYRATYTGGSGATISMDWIVDSEAGFDFLQIESDSACASFERVDFDLRPSQVAASYRNLEIENSGLIHHGEWNVALTDHGPGTHCVYIAFFSDGGLDPCDGFNATSIGDGAVIDNIMIVDGAGSRTEDFEDDLPFDDLNASAGNIQDSKPFGTWARLFPHVTDNDACTENRTCAWLWTDDTRPTLTNDPSMDFGPGGFVVRNWLDDIIESPWVSLASTPTAAGTILQFRRFGGNFFSQSRIVQSWSVRGRFEAPDMSRCLTAWGHATSWNSLNFFGWLTLTFDMTPFINAKSEDLQIRYRTSDWQWIAGAGPPGPFRTGPGPYVDRTRIGRRILTGPVINEGIDARSQAQDAFPGVDEPLVSPGPRFEPTSDRFGTVPFSEGTELGIHASSPNLILGDSIGVQVRAVRFGGETVTAVNWSGAIIAGPHVGKAPAPHAVGANGFFTTPALQAFVAGSNPPTPIPNFFTHDIDDTYLRGGDVLVYFWSATDNGGGFTSDPVGLTGPPASIAAAQTATTGMLEVTALPTINWDPAYLAAIAGHASGDIDPSPAQLAASDQAHCILYVQNTNTRRRSGDVNRTSFMYALDLLGYRGHYDVYDHTGMGNTNNQLGGRATIEQAQGYNLIVYDNGDGTPGRPLLPSGFNNDSEKIDQAQWFQDWLNQAAVSEAQFATLWMIGSNTVEERGSDPLIATDMGVTLAATDQAVNVNPDVDGLVSFTFDQGVLSAVQNFATDLFVLQGGCPVIRNYDALNAQGTAVLTHEYEHPAAATVRGAIVMNRNNAGAWNTIMQSHPFFDIRDKPGTPASSLNGPEFVLLNKVLTGALPVACLSAPGPTDTGDEDELDVPRQTALFQNVPNPFNPMTEISFDLGQNGRVALRSYDVTGRLVRTLIDNDMLAGRGYEEVWNGLDDQNQRAASGIYFYRLDAAGESFTRKMVIMK